MSELVFKDVYRLVKKMVESKERHMPYSKTPTRHFGVTMVKDNGIYLMNLGLKDHWLEGPVPTFVVYAEGYDPTLRAEAPGELQGSIKQSNVRRKRGPNKKYYRRHDGVWTDGDKEEYESLPALQKATLAVCNDTEHVWEDARAAVGGDDFAEWIELDPPQVDTLLKSKSPQIKIKWNRDTYRVACQ